MPDEQKTTPQCSSQSTTNFDQIADKWWESRWAFVMAVAVPLIAVMGVYGALQISDTKQMEQIKQLSTQQTLFQNGDFKDAVNIIKSNQENIVDLRIEIGKLETIINERIPQK